MQNRGISIWGYVYQNPSEILIKFPDFADLEVRGKNIRDAENKGYEALEEAITNILNSGGELPIFKKNFQVKKLREAEVKNGKSFSLMAFVFPLPIKSTPIRFNVIANQGEVSRIDKAAQICGQSRSRFIIDAALERAEKIKKTDL
ncbi:MAG: type II toxin-antitoxin system HicB family antitoxin [Micavibrio sp.]